MDALGRPYSPYFSTQSYHSYQPYQYMTQLPPQLYNFQTQQHTSIPIHNVSFQSSQPLISNTSLNTTSPIYSYPPTFTRQSLPIHSAPTTFQNYSFYPNYNSIQSINTFSQNPAITYSQQPSFTFNNTTTKPSTYTFTSPTSTSTNWSAFQPNTFTSYQVNSYTTENLRNNHVQRVPTTYATHSAPSNVLSNQFGLPTSPVSQAPPPKLPVQVHVVPSAQLDITNVFNTHNLPPPNPNPTIVGPRPLTHTPLPTTTNVLNLPNQGYIPNPYITEKKPIIQQPLQTQQSPQWPPQQNNLTQVNSSEAHDDSFDDDDIPQLRSVDSYLNASLLNSKIPRGQRAQKLSNKMSDKHAVHHFRNPVSKRKFPLTVRAVLVLQRWFRYMLKKMGKQQQNQLWSIIDVYFKTHMGLFPFVAPLNGELGYNNAFGNNLTDSYKLAKKRLARASIKNLQQKVNYRLLSEQDKVTHDIFIWECQNDLKQEENPTQLLPLDHMNGLHETFVFLGTGESSQPFQTLKDYKDWLEKAKGFKVWVESAISRMKEGIRSNITLPRVLAERLLESVNAHCIEDAKESTFYGPIEHLPEDLSKHKTKLEKDYLALIQKSILPTFKTLSKFIEKEYIPKCRKTAGYCGMGVIGRKWYQSLVDGQLTVKYDVNELFDLGEKEVKRIHEEIKKVMVQIGYQGTLSQFFNYVKTDSEFYFKNEEEVLEEYKKLKQKVSTLLPKLFIHIPNKDFEIKTVEEFRAADAPAASYEAGDIESDKPGTFYVNTTNLKACPKWETETLFLHEAVPGHHMATALGQENTNIPKWQRLNSYEAFEEGWALYCESLGREMGMQTDPMQYFGLLHMDLLRSMRLVVDVGIHEKGWTAKKARSYMSDNSGMDADDIKQEVERYMAIPGQALAYKVGQITILECRKDAERALGPSFDIREFHNICLNSGSVPLNVLRTKVQNWIEKYQR